MFVLVLIITFYFYSAIASALAKQEAILSQLHEDLNAYTDNAQVRHLFNGGTYVYAMYTVICFHFLQCDQPIGHSRVVVNLIMKARLSAKLFI